MRKYLQIGAVLAVIVAAIQFGRGDGVETLVAHLRRVAVNDWLVLIAIGLAATFFLSAAFRLSLQVVDTFLNHWHAFRYTVMNSFFNTLLPAKGGLWMRGYYLKQQFDVSWGRYLFVMVSSQLMHLAALMTLALVLSSTAELQLSMPSQIADIAVGAIAIAGISVFSLLIFLEKAKKGLQMWINVPRRLASYLIFSAAFHVASALRLWVAFHVTGTELTVVELALIYSLVTAGLSWAITPGNLGIKEAAIVVVTSAFGVPAEQALAASVVDRIASLLIIIGIGGPASYQVMKRAESQQ